jgi:cytochrome b6-f complex iron-sulfur subunit
MSINRREFVSWMSLGFVITSVVGCNQTTSQSSETDNSETQTESPSNSSQAFQPVGTVEELEKQGTLTDDMMGVIVLRNPNGDLIALNNTCPHRGCAVSLAEDGDTLDCPCHGSRFSIRGKLLQGPATTDLPSYEVKTENNQVLVNMS